MHYLSGDEVKKVPHGGLEKPVTEKCLVWTSGSRKQWLGIRGEWSRMVRMAKDGLGWLGWFRMVRMA